VEVVPSSVAPWSEVTDGVLICHSSNVPLPLPDCFPQSVVQALLKQHLIPTRYLCQAPAKSQDFDPVFLLLLAHTPFHFVKPALHRLDSVPVPQHEIHSLQIQPHIFVQMTNSF
jgi:hypothetical protein